MSYVASGEANYKLVMQNTNHYSEYHRPIHGENEMEHPRHIHPQTILGCHHPIPIYIIRPIVAKTKTRLSLPPPLSVASSPAPGFSVPHALHCALMRLPHPAGQTITIEAPLYPDMTRWWADPGVLPHDGFVGLVT